MSALPPTIAEGLAAAGRALGIEPVKFQYNASGIIEGPDPCNHGYRRGLPCPHCDRATVARAVQMALRMRSEQAPDDVELERLMVQARALTNTYVVDQLCSAVRARMARSGSAETQSPFAADAKTVAAADLSRAASVEIGAGLARGL